MTEGPAPVVFVHGAGMDHTVWRYQTRWLLHRDREVDAVDLPGHGVRSGRALASIPAYAEWLSGHISRWGRPVALVGHSMGGLIGLELAAADPATAEALVLVGTAPRMVSHPDLMDAARADDARAGGFIAGWSFGTAHRGGHPEPGMWQQGATAALVRRAAPGVLAADLESCAVYDAARIARAVSCPTTVVSGSVDRMAPWRRSRELADLVAGSSFVLMEGLGHEPMLENPGRFNPVLEEALKADGKAPPR